MTNFLLAFFGGIVGCFILYMATTNETTIAVPTLHQYVIDENGNCHVTGTDKCDQEILQRAIDKRANQGTT